MNALRIWCSPLKNVKQRRVLSVICRIFISNKIYLMTSKRKILYCGKYRRKMPIISIKSIESGQEFYLSAIYKAFNSANTFITNCPPLCAIDTGKFLPTTIFFSLTYRLTNRNLRILTQDFLSFFLKNFC